MSTIEEEFEKIKNDPNMTDAEKKHELDELRLLNAEHALTTGQHWVDQQTKKKHQGNHVILNQVLAGKQILFADLKASVDHIASICNIDADNVSISIHDGGEDGFYFNVEGIKADV